MEIEFQAALADRIYKVWREEADKSLEYAEPTMPAFDASQSQMPHADQSSCAAIENSVLT